MLLGGQTGTSARIEVAELNGDGRPDFIRMANATTLAYHESLSGGGYATEEIISNTFSTLTSILLADADSDGDRDIIARSNLATQFTIFGNDGAGNFGSPRVVAVTSTPTLRAMADLNGDSRPDLLVTEGAATAYYPQQADGTFGARTELPLGIVANVTVADINQDGIPDLVSSQSKSNITALYDIRWSPGRGAGVFGPAQIIKANHPSNINTFVVRSFDSDADLDIAIGTSSSLQPVLVFMNQTGENPMRLIPPATRSYIAGDVIEMQVHFGFPINVTGTPRIGLQIGANVVHANYVSGSGSPTLIFRYTVTATDVDLDGAQLVVNSIDLNGGTLLNPENGNAVLQFPALTFTGVLVNGAGPLVQNITRLDATPTNATSVRYSVQFTEAVTGVDVSDFSVAMSAGDLAGAVVSSVSGAGTTYEVIVATGTGSGTLGLSVIGTATINDANGDPLGKPYFGGQVYTLRRSEPNDINIFYTDRHADFGPVWNNGEMTFELVADPGTVTPRQVPSDEVYVYLDSNALTSRSTDARFDFLGVPASAPLYRISTSQLTNVPFLGFGGESVPAGVFAGYRPDDPRITSASLLPYLKVQMVDMRSSTDGEFSIWTIASGAPRVWMASSDGISSTDAIYVRSGSHSHFNVGFSKAGVYEVDVAVSGFLDGNGNGVYDPITDPYYESGIFTMVYGIDFLGARDDMFNVGSQETLRGSVTLNDDWDNGLGAYTASVQTTTTKGTLTLQPNGAFTYQPSASFAGSDSFTYRLINPRGGFTTATVTITGSTRPDFDAVLRTGHADIGVNFEDDAWDLHIHDHEPDTEYEPDEALLYVGRDAMLTRTGDAADAAYDFLGAPVGSTLFVLPQGQKWL